ncbi:hypothetical protein ACG93R_05330 [Acinetobacter guillouiae]|uniref:hypothetical protein n=1 Tax=Acinetobacter guillouiae TaxID=106649 RepID=UPI003AF85E27
MSIDNLLDRVWTSKYTCNEFACEAWQQITGEDLTQRLNDFLNGHAGFDVLEEPVSPCIVFFLNGKESPTHVGVFFEDKLLHLSRRGAQYVPLEIIKMGFRQTRYYT